MKQFAGSPHLCRNQSVARVRASSDRLVSSSLGRHSQASACLPVQKVFVCCFLSFHYQVNLSSLSVPPDLMIFGVAGRSLPPSPPARVARPRGAQALHPLHHHCPCAQEGGERQEKLFKLGKDTFSFHKQCSV